MFKTAGLACRKCLAEFAARRRQKDQIIFPRDKCVAEKSKGFFASFNRRGVLWRKITS